MYITSTLYQETYYASCMLHIIYIYILHIMLDVYYILYIYIYYINTSTNITEHG